MRLFSAFLDLLFPPRCVFCRAFTENGQDLICPDCRKKLPYTKNGGERRGDSFSRCVAPLYYKGEVRDSLLRYKFHGAAGYAGAYGHLLADCIRTNMTEAIDLISWVPLSRKRLRTRGYDQARLLARAAAGELGRTEIPVLEKIQETAKQSTTGSAKKRRANIAGAYRVLSPGLVAGKRVLLIDDIITTGATLSECARTLSAAGAREVLCAALAESEDYECGN